MLAFKNMNIQKIIIRIFFLFLPCLILGTSCKDFLEKTSPDITIPTTVQHFEELLYGEGYPIPQLAVLEIMGDNTMFNYASSDVRSLDDLKHSSLYFWDKDQEVRQPNSHSSLWVGLYKAISVCNLVIEGLEKIGDDNMRNHVLGQAYVLRAHHYFLLVNLYGEPYRKGEVKSIGVPIKTASLAEDKMYTRNSVNEVYDLIVKDIEKGLLLMDQENENRGEINYLSALTLASRVALFMEDYDKVLLLGKEYLTFKRPLLTPEDDVKIGKFISVQNKEITMLFGGSYNELTGVYLNTQLATRSSFVVADELYATFNRYLRGNEVDKRMGWFFERSSSGLLYPKKSDTKMRLAYRSAEIYLNLAEAYFENKEFQKSLDHINTLRQSRVQNYTHYRLDELTTLELKQFIEDERRLEYCFEDFRWLDLRRYNREVRHEYQKSDGSYRIVLKPNDWGYVLQIPLIEQNKNSLIELIPHEDRIHQKIQ